MVRAVRSEMPSHIPALCPSCASPLTAAHRCTACDVDVEQRPPGTAQLVRDRKLAPALAKAESGATARRTWRRVRALRRARFDGDARLPRT